MQSRLCGLQFRPLGESFGAGMQQVAWTAMLVSSRFCQAGQTGGTWWNKLLRISC